MAGKIIMNWHEYFIGIAELVKEKSKDRSTKVGAVLVDKDNGVLGVGYNGFPRGVNDNIDKRHKKSVKYFFTEHAERNAIYNAVRNGVKLDGSKLYISGKGGSCADCARAIIQSGIKEVIYIKGKFEGKGSWTKSINIAEEMLEEAGVKISLLSDKFEVIEVIRK